MTDIDAVPLRFVRALNERDAETLQALAEPSVKFRALATTKERPEYVGHAGLREWAEHRAGSELRGSELRVRPRKTRTFNDGRTALLADVLLGDDRVGHAAIVMSLGPEDKVLHVHSYFTDEQLLDNLGFF